MDVYLQIGIHGYEGEYNQSSIYGLINTDNIKTQLELNSIYPINIPSNVERFQVLIYDIETNNVLGSFSMALDEIKNLDVKYNKHWVTLFENPNDDLYDGDYIEDDIETPRILFSYEILECKDLINDIKETSSKISKGILKKGFEPEPFQRSLCLGDEVSESIKDSKKVSTPLFEDLMDQLGDSKEENKTIYATLKASTNVVEKKFNNTKKNLACDITTNEVISNSELRNYLEKHKSDKDSPRPNNTSKEDYSSIGIEHNSIKKSQDESKDTNKPQANLKGKEESKYNVEFLIREVEELAREKEERGKELKKVKEKNKELIERHQAEVKSYNDCISTFIKEKYELQYRITYLENSVEAANGQLRTMNSELELAQERNKKELIIKDSEMKAKFLDYENTIRELKASATSSVKRIEMTFNMQEYSNKLIELENKYIGQIKEVQNKLTESEKKRTEIATELKKLKTNEQGTQEKIKKLEQTKKMLEDTTIHYQNLLKDANKKLTETEKKQMESEQKISIQLGYLNQVNIELTSNVEQLKWKIEQTKDAQNLIKSRDEEIKQLKLLNEELQNRIRDGIQVLRNELNLKVQMWETEKVSLKRLLEQTTGELEEVKAKYFKVKNELLAKNRVEEEALEVTKIANSLESIINEYRSSNKTLMRENLECKEELDNTKKKLSELLISYLQLTESNKLHEEKEKTIVEEVSILKQKEKENEVKLKVVQAEVDSLKNKLQEEYKKAIELKEQSVHSTNTTAKLPNEIPSILTQENPKEEQPIQHTISTTPKKELLEDVQVNIDQSVMNKGERKESTEETKPNVYAPDKTDKIDQMIALYINSIHCPVKVKKIGEGQYMFGTRKIFAKIQNEKLVIRIGGGYTMIEDFLSTYTAQELNKMKKSMFNEAEAFNNTIKEEELTRKKSEKQLLATARVDRKHMGRSKSPLVRLSTGASRSKILIEHTTSNTKIARTLFTKKDVKAKPSGSENENGS